jgi:SAM-dependent methyltransferase
MDALERLRATWGALGEDDPLWAILSDPRKRGGRWDVTEFFAAGEAEIAVLDVACEAFGLPQARRSALDFGCGVGRLSRALAARYANVVGVDISTSMVGHARRLNADRPNLRFVENAQSDLRFANDSSFDLVYSVITLQHMPAALQRAYIAEFLRVLAPDGLGVFQVACGHADDGTGLLHRFVPNALLNPLRRWRYGSRVAFEMHVVAEGDVREIVAKGGRRIIRVDEDACAGAGFVGRRFFIT